MQFVYDKNASEASIVIDNDTYKYLFRARRQKLDDIIGFRNLKDDTLYMYKITNITKKDATLVLTDSIKDDCKEIRKLNLAWLVIDPKVIEKTLPFLNEMGISKISFIYGEYSQKNFKLNYEKFEKILINSCGQCGRTNLIEFESFNSLSEYKLTYPNSFLFNFSTNSIDDCKDEIESIVIGCEGGFSKNELALYEDKKIVGCNSKNILRSESAAVSVAAKILL